jgi:hypothetical protein
MVKHLIAVLISWLTLTQSRLTNSRGRSMLHYRDSAVKNLIRALG